MLHVTGTCLMWLPVLSRGLSIQCLAYSRNSLSTCWMNKWTGNVIKTHENIHHISFTTALRFLSSRIAFGLGTHCFAGLTNSPALWPEGQILPHGNSQSSQNVLDQYKVSPLPHFVNLVLGQSPFNKCKTSDWHQHAFLSLAGKTWLGTIKYSGSSALSVQLR